MRRAVRIGGKVLLAILAVPLLYALAGLIGSSIPTNSGWREPARGVTVYVESNGVHTGLVLPVNAAGVEWRDLVRASDLADPRYARTHLAFGWGDRDFYLNTATWSDIQAGPTIRAAIGSQSVVMHVEHIAPPVPGESVRALVVSEAEYRRLAGFIRAQFATGTDGRAPHVPGYGQGDLFYTATGTYSAFTTCNAWTGTALRHAGVRVGAWTPFAGSVMRWFPQEAGAVGSGPAPPLP